MVKCTPVISLRSDNRGHGGADLCFMLRCQRAGRSEHNLELHIGPPDNLEMMLDFYFYKGASPSVDLEDTGNPELAKLLGLDWHEGFGWTEGGVTLWSGPENET